MLLRLYSIEAFCDNKFYAIKLNELQSNAYSKIFIHKLKVHKAYLALLNILPKNFHLTHVKGHQDDFKTTAELTIPEGLNIETDIIATSKTNSPLNILLPSAPFAIYVHQKYTNLNFQQRIHEIYFENEAKIFLQSKDNWNTPKIKNVEWNLNFSCYKSLSNSENRKISRYIHHRLPPEKWCST